MNYLINEFYTWELHVRTLIIEQMVKDSKQNPMHSYPEENPSDFSVHVRFYTVISMYKIANLKNNQTWPIYREWLLNKF